MNQHCSHISSILQEALVIAWLLDHFKTATVTLELYRNEEEPDRLHAIVNFDTCGNILMQTENTLH